MFKKSYVLTAFCFCALCASTALSADSQKKADPKMTQKAADPAKKETPRAASGQEVQKSTATQTSAQEAKAPKKKLLKKQ